jgi:hypothetical protein
VVIIFNLQKFYDLLRQFIEGTFEWIISGPQKKFRLANGISLGILFLIGIVLWGFFLNWGKGPVDYQDWADITAPRLAFLKNVLIGFHLPLQSPSAFHSGPLYTNHFLAIPDIIIGPEVVLLWFLNITQFSLFHVWLMYLLGFAGLLYLRKFKALSILAFTILFVLFYFNGNIVAHLAVGHLSFASYFLFPWFVYLVFELLEGEGNWQWIARMTFFLFVLVLEGGYHQFAWCLVFFGLLAITYPKHFWLLTKTALLAVAVSLARLLPELSILQNIKNDFIGGYPSVQSMLSGLINIEQPGIETTFDGLTPRMGFWEVTIFIGVVGVIFLIYFGIILPALSEGTERHTNRLVLPVCGLALLSLDQVYRYLRIILPIPVITGERVSTRILSLALVFLLALAAIEFQRWLNSSRTSKLAIATVIGLTLFGLHDIWENFQQWSILASARAFPVVPFNSSAWMVANDLQDRFYIATIIVGLAVTVVSVVFVSFMAVKERRQSRRGVV